MSEDRRSRYRPWIVALAAVAAAGVFLAWAFVEILEVRGARPDPTVDSRARLVELATEHMAATEGEATAAWARPEAVLDDLDAVRADSPALQ